MIENYFFFLETIVKMSNKYSEICKSGYKRALELNHGSQCLVELGKELSFLQNGNEAM